ncbi:MAG TPA: TonB-dependent receptor [Terriglobia bacterium]|nr:TonB-dependent receptor [Terriglobia bacterium]
MFLANAAFAQNAQLGGIVSDPTKALIPGVKITATNTATGVATTTLTNESGAYSFPSLQPGVYRLSAELSGFQTSTVNLELGPIAVRQDIQLKLSTAQTRVEVTAEPQTAVSQSSATVGDVLNQERVSDLPNVGNNVLNLLNVLPGLRLSTTSGGGLMGPQLATINGLDLNSVNVTRDGLTTNDTRFSSAGDITIGVAIPHGGGTGVMSPTTINPDLVGEIRLILSPIDAELGRGNSQIQVQTRSGTNKFTGAAVWNVQNTVLNANTWDNNRQVDPRTGKWAPRVPDWRNVHEYTLSYGGPIVKNKTFFYALWDQNISSLRATFNAHVLTNEARLGIFRSWEGWVGRSADPQNNPPSYPTAAANPNIASVDFAGKPLRPPFWPDGTPYTGRLVCFSVFGNVKTDGTPFTAADCPSGTDSAGNAYTAVPMFPSGASWDAKRPSQFDSNGYFSKVLAAMPKPNNFYNTNGDGLNMGVDQWLLTRRIGDPVFYNETLIGNDPYSNRKQFNIKIDQNFKNHRINGSWTTQYDDNVVLRGEWPDGVGGLSFRRPQIINVGVTSTISPTLLNESRFGYHINKGSQIPPWQMSDSSITDKALPFIGQGGVRPGSTAKYPVLVRPVSGCLAFGNTADELSFDNGIMGTRLNCGVIVPNLIHDPLYEWLDTVSWTHGKHAFKFGSDLRFPRTDGYAFQPYVNAPYGNLGGTPTQSPFVSETAGTGTPTLGPSVLPVGQTYATVTNIFRQTERNLASNLAYLLTDSVGSLNTPYWIDSQANKDAGITGWQDITTENNRYRSTISTDYAFFAKDDYKIAKNLTLNLGLRYEYYAPPYLKNGLTATAAGLGVGLFGASRGAGGELFDNWLQPGNLYLTNYGNVLPSGATPLDCQPGVTQSPLLPVSSCDPNKLTAIQFVGPDTTNPSKTVISRNRKNFGPAVGFAWQVPWFGEGKTTVRGGFSIQYQRLTVRDDILASAPGNTLNQTAATTDPDIAAIIATRAVSFTDLPTIVPRLPQVAPGLPTPVYAKNTSFTAYDPNLSTPYVENVTLSVTRTLNRNMTLDVRYIGTLARKGLGSVDVNTSTVMYNPELFNALQVTRAGGDDPLFDQMFAGIRLSGVPTTVPVVNGTTSRGSDQLRQSTATRANLANGNFVAVANALITPATLSINAGASGIQGLSPGPAFAILHNGCDRLANGLVSIATRCFPENYLSNNPQLNGATYIGNLAHSNYHALQVSYTLRPTQGFSVQTTYSWAKSMQLGAGGGLFADAGSTGGSGYTDPLMRSLDRVRGLDQLHSLRTNGTIELPLGPNKLLFGNATGWAARLIEKWQTSFILNMGTGTPVSVGGAGTMRYGNARFNPTPNWQLPQGQVQWTGATGTYFGDKFVTQKDAQCLDTTLVAASLSGFCTLNMLTTKVPAGTPGATDLGGGTFVVPVLVNPKPGEIGKLGSRNLDSFGTFFLDGNVQKSFRLSESKQLTVRVDATNILNHPQLAAPNFTVGNTLFGQIANKGTTIFGQATPVQRNFQGQLRFTF